MASHYFARLFSRARMLPRKKPNWRIFTTPLRYTLLKNWSKRTVLRTGQKALYQELVKTDCVKYWSKRTVSSTGQNALFYTGQTVDIRCVYLASHYMTVIYRAVLYTLYYDIYIIHCIILP